MNWIKESPWKSGGGCGERLPRGKSLLKEKGFRVQLDAEGAELAGVSLPRWGEDIKVLGEILRLETREIILVVESGFRDSLQMEDGPTGYDTEYCVISDEGTAVALVDWYERALKKGGKK